MVQVKDMTMDLVKGVKVLTKAGKDTPYMMSLTDREKRITMVREKDIGMDLVKDTAKDLTKVGKDTPYMMALMVQVKDMTMDLVKGVKVLTKAGKDTPYMMAL